LAFVKGLGELAKSSLTFASYGKPGFGRLGCSKIREIRVIRG